MVAGAGDVVVYEAVPVDTAGAPTTRPSAMARMSKDTRLLPRGWRPDGPHGDRTAPVGTAGDPDFAAGGDEVQARLARGRLGLSVRSVEEG